MRDDMMPYEDHKRMMDETDKRVASLIITITVAFSVAILYTAWFFGRGCV